MLRKSSQKLCPLTDPLNTEKGDKCILTFPKMLTEEDLDIDGTGALCVLRGCKEEPAVNSGPEEARKALLLIGIERVELTRAL